MSRVLMYTPLMDIQQLITEGTFERSWRVCSQDSSLNPAIAYAMNILAGLDEKDRTLDPCCGTGTILIERQSLKLCICVGVDINPKALDCAKQNTEAAKAEVELKHGDITEKKFPEGYFTKIISNLPFGIHSGSRQANVRLYRFLADKSINWLKPGGRAVFITQAKKLLRDSFAHNPKWKLVEEVKLEIGGLTPSIFIYEKSIS